jgi:hypothetical protein
MLHLTDPSQDGHSCSLRIEVDFGAKDNYCNKKVKGDVEDTVLIVHEIFMKYNLILFLFLLSVIPKHCLIHFSDWLEGHSRMDIKTRKRDTLQSRHNMPLHMKIVLAIKL